MMFLKLSLNILLYIVVTAMAFSPHCLTPLHYNLNLNMISTNALRCQCNATVYNNCATQNITLHVSTHINVWNMYMKSVTSTKIYTPDRFKTFPNNGTIVFNFAEQLGANTNLEHGFYILYIEFDNLISFRYAPKTFRTYWYEHKEEEWMIAILNEPRTARELFPCLDEPELSATFNISVHHTLTYRSISNSRVRDQEEIYEKGMMITHFNTTPEMSPNDVVIIIYKYNAWDPVITTADYLQPRTTIKSVLYKRRITPHMEVAQYVIDNIITYLLLTKWKFFKIIPKLDYVAVPNFKNKIWQTSGLIIYNETEIIYNEELQLPGDKFKVMRTMAHAMISQWYGYLFDPSCWSYWWLNEGFNLYLETYIIGQALPDSQIMDLFVVQANYEYRYLRINSEFDRNNFTKDASDTFKINSIIPFSPIKGAVIWRMLESVIPDYIFWTSVNTYKNLANFNSKTPDDLWNFMETETKKYEVYDIYYLQNLKEMMDIWTTQKYCPVLNVIRDYSNDQVIISKEFDENFGETPYFIPVSYTINTDINFNISWPNINDCLTNSRPTLEILLDKKVKWIIVNIQHTGYYRVNYDYENWQRLARYLNSANYTNIHVLNRAQIIDDAFYFAINGKLDFSVFWELASYLPRREKNYVAWYPMIKAFEYTSIIFVYPNNTREFPKTLQNVLEKIRNLFEPIKEDFYNQTVPTNNNLDASLKQEVTRIACIINNPLCNSVAERQLELYITHIRKPNTKYAEFTFLPGWEKWTYCNGLKYANFTTWFYAWEEAFRIFKERFDYKMMEGLICSEDPQIITYFLSFHLANLKNKMTINKNKKIATEIERKVDLLTANIYLSILSRHAKNTATLKRLLEHFKLIHFSHVNIYATVVVMINNAYSSEQLNEIHKFTNILWISVTQDKYIASTIKLRSIKMMKKLIYFRNLYVKPRLN